MSDWINTKDCLPEPNTKVFVWSSRFRDESKNYTGITVAHLDENRNWHAGRAKFEDITTFKIWKPLPEGLR
ncbi:MAG: DUF551 domain-containing protein [Calditrichaceae bacterium]